MMKRGSRARSTLVTLLMLLPGLAGFFGLFFYPMMITVVRSMRPEGETVGWTLEHYAQFLGEPRARGVIVLTWSCASCCAGNRAGIASSG
jgi:ABC-type spermidine/putrescine transport system permease subunit II